MAVLLCDLDDTLFDHDRATRDALALLRERHPILQCWSLEELDARHRILLEALHVDVLAGRLLIDEARRERFARLLAQAGAEDDSAADALASVYRGTYASCWYPVSGAVPFLQTLRAEGETIVIVTNNNVAEQQLKLQRCGLEPLIDLMITSEELGIAKPSRGIFDYALQRTGAAADDAVMLGDAWATDVEGARAAGITPVWFNPAGRPSPDPSVAELSSLAPAAEAIAILRRAGLGTGRARSGGVHETQLRAD